MFLGYMVMFPIECVTKFLEAKAIANIFTGNNAL